MTQEISIDHFKPLHIEKMLQYLYTGDYTVEIDDVINAMDHTTSSIPLSPVQSADCEECLVALRARMYDLGDYFQIDALKVTAKRQFQIKLERGKTEEALVEVIKVVYNSTPESDKGLRDILIDDIVILDRRLSRGVLRKVPDEFAFDVRISSLYCLRVTKAPRLSNPMAPSKTVR